LYRLAICLSILLSTWFQFPYINEQLTKPNPGYRPNQLKPSRKQYRETYGKSTPGLVWLIARLCMDPGGFSSFRSLTGSKCSVCPRNMNILATSHIQQEQHMHRISSNPGTHRAFRASQRPKRAICLSILLSTWFQLIGSIPRVWFG
jgi:hypothetical protein